MLPGPGDDENGHGKDNRQEHADPKTEQKEVAPTELAFLLLKRCCVLV
jgi:hypothetical protein